MIRQRYQFLAVLWLLLVSMSACTSPNSPTTTPSSVIEVKAQAQVQPSLSASPLTVTVKPSANPSATATAIVQMAPTLQATEAALVAGIATKPWSTFVSQNGYQFDYPSELEIEERVKGFFALLYDAENPMSDAYSVDDRGVMTVEQRKVLIRTELLIDPVFSDLPNPGIKGFVAEGTMGPGMGEGLHAKMAVFDINGREVALACSWVYCEPELFDRVVASFRLN